MNELGTPPRCDHKYVDGYYGLTCTLCGDFIPYGSEPWAYLTDEEEEHIARQHYYETHGYCSTCGGEYGDGWSNCTCEREEGYGDDK